MSSFAFLKQLPTTPNEKGLFSHLAINEILEGEIDPLQALAILKHIEDTIKTIQTDKRVLDLVFSELDKYGKQEKATAYGFEISQGQRRTYDYSNCGDIHLEDLKTKEVEVKESVKQREKFLQSLKQKMFDSENGGFEVCPPQISYTTYPILKEVKQGIELPPNPLPF